MKTSLLLAVILLFSSAGQAQTSSNENRPSQPAHATSGAAAMSKPPAPSHPSSPSQSSSPCFSCRRYWRLGGFPAGSVPQGQPATAEGAAPDNAPLAPSTFMSYEQAVTLGQQEQMQPSLGAIARMVREEKARTENPQASASQNNESQASSAAKDQVQPAPPQKSSTVLPKDRPIKNIDVIMMFRQGVTPGVIVLAIQKSKTDFATSPDALIQMKKMGLPDEIVTAMLNARSQSNKDDSASNPSSTAKPPKQ